MPAKPEEQLSECFEKLLNGEDAADCLAAHPEDAAAVKPLVAISQSTLQSINAIEPPPGLKTRIRLQMLAALEERRKAPPAKAGFFGWGWLPHYANAIAAVLIVLVLGTATVALSVDAEPDNPLYALKLTTEQVRLALTTAPAAKAQLRTDLAGARVTEIAYLASRGKADLIPGVVNTLSADLGAPTPAGSSETKGVTISQAPAAAPAPPVPSAAPQAALAPTPVPAPAAGPGRSSADNSTFLAAAPGVEARSIAVLQSALQLAPDDATRAALRDAIARATAAYQAAVAAGTLKP